MADARVLICDDEPALRELMRLALDGAYEIAEATNAAEALASARDFRPDVILLDVMMPGESGLEVLRQLRLDPELRATAVVVVSAWSSEADRRAASAADAFIGKPFDPEELAAIVEGLLAARR
jgi:two-component system phosphate regulon response regulator PhoB